MALSPRLHIRQKQSPVVTPQLIQAIRLLQMSSLDLAEFVEAELQSNPLLSRRDEATFERNDEADGGNASAELPDAEVVDMHGALGQTADTLTEAIDISAFDVFPDVGAPGEGGPDNNGDMNQDRAVRRVGDVSGRSGAGFSDGMSGRYENFPGSQGLVAMIEAAIAAAMPDPEMRMIAMTLLADLDGSGYLGTPLPEIAAALGVDHNIVKFVLRQCQDLAPSGVFARSLKECLALQLAERNRLDPAMQALLDNLDLIAAHRMEELRACCGVGLEDFDAMIAEIRELDPKPGQVFAEFRPQVVIPDILVRRASAGGWALELNDATLPRILVDRTYYAEIAGRLETGEDKKFLTECMQQANWLEKSLDQRARTILKVASEILRQQDAFLAHGVSHLRPLNLRAIAESVGMHESTISRATANKYMATPRGIFALKYFFSSSVPAAGGGDGHSAESVKRRIRNLIENEPPDAIFSDDAIVDHLRPDGILIARRTVAKYRDLMHIPSSVERRREKRAAAVR